jgi:hypothetical protein
MEPTNYMNYRDIEYENNNTINDKNGLCIKCKNYELCETTLALDHFKMVANYLCMTCGSWFKINSFGWNELEFKECNEDCDICSENVTRKLKFPTNCGHWFCISCSRNILFYDESRYYINATLYGCPPCPNKCINPDKGRQCGCEEYDEIQDQWRQEFLEQFNTWNKAEQDSILIGCNSMSSYGTCKCPLCRKTYVRVSK